MKTEPNHPIAQCRHQDGSLITRNSFTRDGEADDFYVLGLSKREHFAAMAMQGLLSAVAITAFDSQELTEASVRIADELITALNKKEQ